MLEPGVYGQRETRVAATYVTCRLIGVAVNWVALGKLTGYKVWVDHLMVNDGFAVRCMLLLLLLIIVIVAVGGCHALHDSVVCVCELLTHVWVVVYGLAVWGQVLEYVVYVCVMTLVKRHFRLTMLCVCKTLGLEIMSGATFGNTLLMLSRFDFVHCSRWPIMSSLRQTQKKEAGIRFA
jgi:hypothetical protein